MRKKILLLVMGVMLVLATACTQEKDERALHFSVDEGKQIVNQFLSSTVRNDKAGAEKNLTEDAKRIYAKVAQNLQASGFTISEANELEGGAEYRGKIFESKARTPFFAIDNLVITMTKSKEGDYVISNIVLNKEITVTQRDKSLVANENGSESVLVSLDQLPSTAAPKEAAAENQFGVDRNKFGAVALSPDKNTLIFSTNGVHGFVARYDLSSQQITPVDLYFEGGINRISWSPDGNIYAVEISTPKGTNNVVLYEAMADGKYPFPGGEIFKDPEFSISKPLFVENNFYYYAEHPKNKTVNGWWVYNFKSGKIGKVLR